MSTSAIHTILFDLGGVLFELTGVQTICNWSGNKISEDELWRKWLTSPAVRSFESGRISTEEFSVVLKKEFDLPINTNDLIKEFQLWLKGLYPGAKELLLNLSTRYRLACFSNTNELHWPRIKNDFGIYDFFEKHYASHKMGMLKPDDEAFEYVIKDLNCPPDSILFLDDNQINVDAAVRNGLTAYCVFGVKQAHDLLYRLNLL